VPGDSHCIRSGGSTREPWSLSGFVEWVPSGASTRSIAENPSTGIGNEHAAIRMTFT